MSKGSNTKRLVFRVREPGDAHPTFDVVATGSGHDLRMTCTCLAGQHGALLCPHIVAIVREDADLVMYGREGCADLRAWAVGSPIADKTNGYWKFYPDDPDAPEP